MVQTGIESKDPARRRLSVREILGMRHRKIVNPTMPHTHVSSKSEFPMQHSFALSSSLFRGRSATFSGFKIQRLN